MNPLKVHETFQRIHWKIFTVMHFLCASIFLRSVHKGPCLRSESFEMFHVPSEDT
jgi:hypothetical protein